MKNFFLTQKKKILVITAAILFTLISIYSYKNGNRVLSFYVRGEQAIPKVLSIKPTCNFEEDKKGNIKFPFYDSAIRFVTVEVDNSRLQLIVRPSIKTKLYIKDGAVVKSETTTLTLPFYEEINIKSK